MQQTPLVPSTGRTRLGPNRWLTGFAVAYGVLHHQGFLFGGLGTVGFVADGGTRVADWLDLATPFLVLGPAVGALAALGRVARSTWVLAVVGLILYVEGHGIHLAANSIANEQEAAGADVSAATHLWDEPVGHHLWFAGLALVVAALVAGWRRAGSPIPRGPVTSLLAAQFGVTWATNGLEGGTAIFSGLVSAGFVGWAAMTIRRDDDGPSDGVASTILWAFAPALALIAGYGAIHRGFPQPSEIGWGVFG